MKKHTSLKNSKILVYTFRTFKGLDELDRLDCKVIILGKLKEDIEDLFTEIRTNNYDHILGIANSRNTLIETVAVNQFNKGIVSKGGKSEYELDPLPGLDLIQHKRYWTSFCNWAAYKVTEEIDRTGIDIKSSFIHVKSTEIETVIGKILKVYG